MVSGKPYISVNRATIKALKAKERQSRGDCGLPKLKAKMMKMAEFRMTSIHSP